ncbi:unnamed protein product [Protopolystoma xenopodis]|uniref:Uncharacterized protein n=1 Tax=Protopolystoma xenopodis TaxID=117903 RepID=A0A3S5AM45_9PLAT|nr:unnamed protein product [Protopolystoma xenopodis]
MPLCDVDTDTQFDSSVFSHGSLGKTDISAVSIRNTSSHNEVTTSTIASSVEPVGSTFQTDRRTIYVTDRLFPYLVLSHLGKIYIRATSPVQLDFAAVSIQEILKLYKVSEALTFRGSLGEGPRLRTYSAPSGDSENLDLHGDGHNFFSGQKLWYLFSEELRDLFAPLLSSRYVFNGKIFL